LFPLRLLERNLYLANLGKYIHDVLAPKINRILTQLAEVGSLASEYITWEADQFPGYLRGILKWEDYRIKTQFRGNFLTFAVIVVIRYLFASAPFFLFLLAFFAAKATTSFWISWSIFEKRENSFHSFDACNHLRLHWHVRRNAHLRKIDNIK
jgi:hypothetical protein